MLPVTGTLKVAVFWLIQTSSSPELEVMDCPTVEAAGLRAVVLLLSMIQPPVSMVRATPAFNVIVEAALGEVRQALTVLLAARVRAAVVSLTFWVAVAVVMSPDS